MEATLVKRVVVLLFLGTLGSACATPPLGQVNLLGFIQDGRTSREETLLHLGEPAALYEAGRRADHELSPQPGQRGVFCRWQSIWLCERHNQPDYGL